MIIFSSSRTFQLSLDNILDFQISPLDKTGLGYKKNKEKSEDDTWSPKTPEAGPSTSKVAPHAPAHDNKDFGSSKMKQGVRSIPQSNFIKETTPRPRYESGFNGYCYFRSNFGHKAMGCRFYGRRRAGSPNDSVRCWTCNQVEHVVATSHIEMLHLQWVWPQSPRMQKSKKSTKKEYFIYISKKI